MNETKLPPYPLGGSPEDIRNWVKQYNKLFPPPMEFIKERETEWINEETGEYEKNRCKEDSRYNFYLRFVKEHFKPCLECQKALHELIYNADKLYLGNKSYEPAIELSREWAIDDGSWVELETRKATKDDFKRIYGYKWKEYWKAHQEAFNK